MKYCEDCDNFILATQYDNWKDQIDFACCKVFPRAYPQKDPKRFVAKDFDVAVVPEPQYCTVAREQESMCGPDAKAFVPRSIP